jgi:glycosyltransferase involved in cell wall biosynthesis
VVLAEKFLAVFTDHLLAVGEKVRQDLLLAGIGSKNRFGLMPPGLSIGPLPPKRESCESLGLLTNQLQCAFIGRITQIKRPDRFLDLVAEVNRRKIEMNFFIAGDGELMDLTRKRIVDENLPVTILGWQSDIEKVLSAADIVVLTSDNEGTPLSLIQAGMSALPVVTTNVGSVPEVVLDGVTGLVTSMDIHEMADALEKLFNDAGLRAQYGIAAQEFTLAQFGVKRLVHDHEELYKNLLSSPAKS